MSIMTERHGLVCGDKITVLSDSDCNFDTGVVIQITRDDDDSFPRCKQIDNEYNEDYFDLQESKWEKYNEFPLKRDDKITLELTGEQVFWIALLAGNTNGGWDQKQKLYQTTKEMLNDFFSESRCIQVENLYCSKEYVEKALQAAFPPEQVEPEIEELTLEEICEQLGKNIKIVKNKE